MSDAAIVDAIMSLAKTLDLVVTAEGVERRGQLEWLRARGYHEVQGFLLSRPLSARHLEDESLLSAPARAISEVYRRIEDASYLGAATPCRPVFCQSAPGLRCLDYADRHRQCTALS